VQADADTPRGRRVLSKGRMEGFSDGVFGFAITLLVVDIALHPPGTPLQQALHAWPAYLAYLTSFLTIGGAWLLHTALTDQLARIDELFLRLNLFLLLVVVLLPFPTRLMAEALNDSSRERVYVTMYGLTLLAIRLLGPPWMRTRGMNTSTRGLERARSCSPHSGNFCPLSPGM
jgi:uncharacterized membrane protein